MFILGRETVYYGGLLLLLLLLLLLVGCIQFNLIEIWSHLMTVHISIPVYMKDYHYQQMQ